MENVGRRHVDWTSRRTVEDDGLRDYFNACEEESGEDECGSSSSGLFLNKNEDGRDGSAAKHHVIKSLRVKPLELRHVFSEKDEDSFCYGSPPPRRPHSQHIASFLSSTPADSIVLKASNSVVHNDASIYMYLDEVEHLRSVRASLQKRKKQILLDALASVMQSENQTFEVFPSYRTLSSTEVHAQQRRWKIREEIKAELLDCQLMSYILSVRSLLEIAADIATLQLLNEKFRRFASMVIHNPHLNIFTTDSLGQDVPSCSFCDGTVGLGMAGFATLSRLSFLIRSTSDSFFQSIMELIDALRSSDSVASGGTPVSHEKDNNKSVLDAGNLWSSCLPFVSPEVPQRSDEEADCSTSSRVLDVISQVEENSLPLRRWLVILKESQCFERFVDTLSSPGSDASLSHVSLHKFALICAKESQTLLDFLVIRCSSLQDASCLDLYQCYMMLVVFLSWPYLELATSAMYGFVHSIDAETWRQLLPRMLRVSFSHLRLSGSPTENPTDVLSLILNCIEYRFRSQAGDDRATSSSMTAEYSGLISARRFILQSFSTFATKRSNSCRDFSKRVAEEVKEKNTHATACNEYTTIVPLGFVMGTYDPALSKSNGKEKAGSPSQVKLWWQLQIEKLKLKSNVTIANPSNQMWAAMSSPGISSPEFKGVELWLNTCIPAARWLTAALLVPFGLTVHFLQQRRLKDLFRASLSSSPLVQAELQDDFFIGGKGNENFSREKKRRQESSRSRPNLLDLTPIKCSEAIWGHVSTRGAACISYSGALRLLLDIALCCDRERVVDGFLTSLYVSGSMHVRDSDVQISSTFLEAVRGMDHGHLVELLVLPGRRGKVRTVLDIFSSFQLRFTFPEELSLILLPNQLSCYVNHVLGKLDTTYSTLFWQHRRGVDKEGNDSSLRLVTQPLLSSEHSGIRFSDVWSCVFGYLCSLHYSRIALRERRKTLQLLDVLHHQEQRVLGMPSLIQQRERKLMSRGVESALYALSFALDSVISFTLHEVHAMVYEIQNNFFCDNTFDSCTHLCQRLDELLMQLHAVCFPSQQPLCISIYEAGSLSHVGEVVRSSVNEILSLSLHQSQFTNAQLSMRTKRAVEAIIAVVSASPHISFMSTRLRPLCMLLTFNNYYGDVVAPFRFR